MTPRSREPWWTNVGLISLKCGAYTWNHPRLIQVQKQHNEILKLFLGPSRALSASRHFRLAITRKSTHRQFTHRKALSSVAWQMSRFETNKSPKALRARQFRWNSILFPHTKWTKFQDFPGYFQGTKAKIPETFFSLWPQTTGFYLRIRNNPKVKIFSSSQPKDKGQFFVTKSVMNDWNSLQCKPTNEKTINFQQSRFIPRLRTKFQDFPGQF